MWISEQSHKKSIRDDKKHLRWLNTYLHDKALIEINKNIIDELKQAKLDTGVQNATANRILALVRSILNCAKDEWEWLDNAPTIRLGMKTK